MQVQKIAVQIFICVTCNLAGTLGVAERSDGGSAGRSPMGVIAQGYREAGGRRAKRSAKRTRRRDGNSGGVARWQSLQRDIGRLVRRAG